MKKFYFALLFIGSSLSLSAQIEVYAEGTTTDISGTEVYATGDDASMHYYFDLKNVSGSQIELTVRRQKLQDVSGTTDYFCWGQSLLLGQCYEAMAVSPHNPWTAPDDYTFDDDATGILHTYYNPTEEGTAKFRYYFVDDNDVAVDSIDVVYSMFLSVKPQQPVDISIYPNPANEVLNILMQNSTSNYSVSIFNLVGKEVSHIDLVNGKNQLNVSELTPGVYFYSIKNNSDILETKKLIIK